MTKGVCPFATQIPGVRTFAPGFVDRVGFCDHTAAGYMGTLKNPAFWNGVGTSVHFCISRTGEIVQLVNIFDTAYAQGRLGPWVSWQPYAGLNAQGGQWASPNGYLISTEHEDEAVLNREWTPEMYEADLRLKRWCVEECARYGMDVMRFGLDSLAGHYMFDGVDRANCPGSGWPRDALYADLTRASEPAPPEPDREMIAITSLGFHLQMERNGWGTLRDVSDFSVGVLSSLVEKVKAAKRSA